MQPRSPSRSATPRIEELIARRDLSAVFQPIIDFDGGAILGYEGLIRGPSGTSLEAPFALFSQALAEGCTLELEQAAARTCIDAFAKLDVDGKLFLNFSAGAIRRLAEARDDTLALLRHRGVDPHRIVIELTEQSTILDVASFVPVISALRTEGAQFALDDYGTANASMNLWVRLQPDVVKIDRFFIHGISSDSLKFEAVRAMQHFANASGARLVAEGIEDEADLIVVRDMGIGCGQGFFFGRPHAQPSRSVTDDARDALLSGHIAVFPETTRTVSSASPSGGMASAKMMVHAPALPRHATNNDVLELFNRLPDLHAVAVVENDEPVALINRRSFMDRYALPYHRELFGKRPCLQFANASPVIIEQSMTVEQMAKLLASDDQRYLADGFVITDKHGKYAGLGTGENLVRAVTEVRIEAARYANPLTFLPGNIPISSHIARLLGNDAGFYACYVDLNHFKPFNDQYGYWQGDEVLKFAAAVLADVCDPTRDFLGHVGGDDFLILFQSEDWKDRVLRAIHLFNEGAQRFYAPADRLAGGIHGEDRRGNPTFFGFVTMAIGCVRVESDGGPSLYSSEEIASVAALAKRRAKHEASGFVLIEADESVALLRGQADVAAMSFD
ncbi:EAL domain-containing protein [Paraburkholderia fungorum]|jgi:EAL domain-containing protein (putative c-di-GMP-specific phosphodiesterase class I)/GGDEF domain-containing protein|uniref:Phosphodiesterase n=1 Tax=Paraburkholderia fungorum TaxID=134537 RepID=A0AAP1L334_9BURK|nr:phosphodiesterase [Paraburkholderia fungorum]MBB4518371.1 EAL domain-containing protein (putative c-di-GMP-specific phosphodiesterase class I)/GGDEF domain-containing protein [Paraburkholderia fungorum]MBB6206312.1 EAL domain-containing protein (putative c-di-GMP-specific phosphodiesterase class I)/GGDEF domain-containing protein [Paraburkholderia fungorum]MDT8837832.1 phosphodiesterase [Paraburkholderia fungorum]PRZ55594.1 diguanylate cyclase/phosphodiesterase [Paraburkholderia fungorum]